jgi:hypothetical protein
VTGVGGANGGTVVLVNSAQDWLDGDGDLLTGFALTIRRVVPIVQEADIRNLGAFYPEVHEDAFDYSVMISQQQQEEIDRSVKSPTTLPASSFDPTLPADINQASVSLVTNPAGNGFLVGPSASAIEGANADALAAAASAAAALVSETNAAASEAAAAASAAAADIPTHAAQTQTHGVSSGSIMGTESVLLNSNNQVSNIGIVTSVATNALTIELKQADASTNATSGSPIRIAFRSATAGTGSLLTRSVTSALSVVVPSGATLGHASATASYIYVYAIDNAGTVELAVSSIYKDELTLHNTTAISSSSDADGFYSTSARTGVAVRLIGKLAVTEATAGTWATNASQVDVVGGALGVKGIPSVITITRLTTPGSGTYTTPYGCKSIRIRMVGAGGGGGGGGTIATVTNGTAGGHTIFDGVTAGGGGGGTTGMANGGPTAGLESRHVLIFNVRGSRGGGFTANHLTNFYLPGGNGGASVLGGAGTGNTNSAGSAADNPSGSGGGGGGSDAVSGCYGMGGGAAGAYLEFIINNPAPTYSYTVGLYGGGGAGGTSGYAGGDGSNGIIIVEERS